MTRGTIGSLAYRLANTSSRADLHLLDDSTKTWHGDGSFNLLKQDTVLRFFSGNKLHPSDAVGFQLGEGEDRSGEDIEVPLSRLHSISGHLTAVTDGHTLNAGNVTLLSAVDGSQVASASLIHDDTAFHFHLVPEGDYFLRVDWAEDANYKEARDLVSSWVTHTIKSYAPTEQTIHITGDQADLVIAVPNETSGEAAN
jgi:hypothetical protein